MWKDGIDSGVNAVYVDNLFPRRGQVVTLSISIPDEGKVEKVFLMTVSEGRDEKRECVKEGSLHSSRVTMRGNEGLLWYFVLKVGEKYWYYSEKGLSPSPPSHRDAFFLKEDIDAPLWAAGATCYQIFPDRFCRGDESVGAKEGEYSFDGGLVTVHGFDEKPLPFEEGRCLDFFNGDLRGIEEKLDYLQSLGVTMLYLNPIGVSMTTHRYDCDDFFHVDEKLGGDRAFASLCGAVHEKGMRIIVDISINHTGAGHPWLRDEKTRRAYYYTKSDGSVECWQDVKTLPQLNYGSEALRQIIYGGKESVLRKFLREPYRQDGWRMDVASDVGRRGDDNFCHEVWKGVRKAVKEENREAYIVGEEWGDASSFLRGDEWDATMNYFGCARPLRSWMGETDRYLAGGWGTNPEDCVPYSGEEFAAAIETALLSVPAQMRFFSFNLFDSHDTPRLSTKGKDDFSLYSGIVMMQYLLPGFPSTYYGDEIALEGAYGTIENCRHPMQWDEKKWDERYLSLYRYLGKMRLEHRSLLSFGAWAFVGADDETVAFARYDRHEALITIMNRARERKSFVMDNRKLRMTREETGRLRMRGETMVFPLEPEENIILHLERS